MRNKLHVLEGKYKQSWTMLDITGSPQAHSLTGYSDQIKTIKPDRRNCLSLNAPAKQGLFPHKYMYPEFTDVISFF